MGKKRKYKLASNNNENVYKSLQRFKTLAIFNNTILEA